MKAVEVVSTVKEGNNLRDLPLSFSSLDANKVNDNHITSMKGISTIVPNLFIPDYGSRLTSAVYIRGIGSRMNGSAVGLYVDNMPAMASRLKPTIENALPKVEMPDVNGVAFKPEY